MDFFKTDLSIKSITVACYVAPGAGSLIHKNRLWHGLSLNLSGEKDYVFESGERLKVKKGDVIYLPKNSSYEVVLIQKGDCYAINFLFDEERTFSPFALNVKEPQNILASFEAAEKAWGKKKDGYDFKCKSELYNIIYLLSLEQSVKYTPTTKKEIILPAINYIHEHYTDEPIDVNFLGVLCGISHEYLRQLFMKFYNCTPIKYINELKLKRAKELLSSGLYTVTNAALDSGFSDMSYFSRAFKNYFGKSPKFFIDHGANN